MNIFFLDYDPKLCAAYHCDKHSVKMVAEYSQILSTVHRLLNSEFSNRVLRPTHVHNRTVKWVMQSKEHYIWLCNLLSHLSIEYTTRYNRLHKYEFEGLIELLRLNVPFSLPDKKLCIDEFESIVDESSYVINDPITSYRNCYMNEKRHILKYKLGNWPEWFV